jgi:hypothetical protein
MRIKKCLVKVWIIALLFSIIASIAIGATVGDVNGDGVIGLEEAVYALQVVAGLRQTGNDTNGSSEFFAYPEKDSLLNFKKVRVNESRYITISFANTGDGVLNIKFVSMQGPHAADFKVEENSFPLSAKKGDFQSVRIICSPTETGSRKAYLLLTCNDPDMPILIKYTLECEAEPADPYCNLNTFFDIENNQSIGAPGKGYDSDRDRIKSSSCLNGEFVETGASSSEVIVDQITSYEELYEKIISRKKSGGKFKAANIQIWKIALGLSFGKEKSSVFTSEIRKKSLSESFVYQYTMRAPNGEFELDPSENTLNWMGQSVYERGQCQFRSTCGDQFVYQIERGGSLYVALSFDFKSDFHKETFQKSSKGNFGISIDYLVDINTIKDALSSDKKTRSYSATKSYFVLDIVSHEDLTWVCIKDGKGNEPAAGSSYWKRKESPTDYDDDKDYSVGDFVNFLGELWGCVKATCNSEDDNCKDRQPSDDSPFWKKCEEPNEEEEIHLAQARANWEKFYQNISEETKKNTRLTIHAIQIGGNAGELPQIFSDKNGDSSASISCSLVSEEEASPCKEAISRIIQYAASAEFANGMEEKPTILNYRYRPYEEAGVFPGLISDLTDGILQAREDLAAEFEEQTGDKELAEFKLDEFKAMLDDSEKAELNDLINMLELNLNNMLDSASICFSNLPACENSVAETLSNLLPYDKILLELPEPITIDNVEEVLLGKDSIQKYCELPPDYVLTGIGVSAGNSWNSWSTVKLEGRRINANGTLGSRETFCDGQVSHWISVPEDKNYVITGLGVARRFWKTNDWGNVKYHTEVTALHGWYREFDPINRQLKGESGVLTEGGASLEALYLPEEHGLDIDHAVIKGVGMGLDGQQFGGMKIKVGNIN